MEIHGNEHLNRLGRKQELERRLAKAGSRRAGRTDEDAAVVDASGEERISRAKLDEFVAILRQMEPTDLHRLEELRERIEDGRYQASVDELLDPLLRFLEPIDESDG